ncbi:unnamed protein product [Arctia plantaginis]|uniref:Uncharacterized protein n=1 Tax=Arctia plantaginis TaxID=874455 RepID=A0A8S0ZGA1_ARCPL|nr:unnamed protein product [Arctia plantaginis]
MKVLLITIFIVIVSTLPIPDENNEPLEIINGVYEGESLKIKEVLDVKLNQDTKISHIATDLHQPYTTVDVGETNNSDLLPVSVLASVTPTNENSGSVKLLKPVTAEPFGPEAIGTVFPETFDPKTVVPETVVVITAELVASTTTPDSDDVASSDATVIVDLSEEVPTPAAQDSEFYNDEIASLSVNGSESPGMLSTLQSWFNMVLNYFNNEGNQSTEDLDLE